MAMRSKILIVDDEPFNVDYLEQELVDLGYETISAGNGQEALQRVRSDSPDLILLDVMMPVMDGLTVCRILKEQDETRLIPIVIMTALDRIEDRIAGIKAGADDFLTKPVDDRELVARIETTLKLKHSVDRKLGELRRAKDHLAKFVPEAVRRIVMGNAEAPGLATKHERDVSALFVDISGYTRLSERLPLATLNEIVERYFSVFLDRICEAGGDMNETTGDGFLAIFHDADRLKHPATAIDTALSLLATHADIPDGGKSRGYLFMCGTERKPRGLDRQDIAPGTFAGLNLEMHPRLDKRLKRLAAMGATCVEGRASDRSLLSGLMQLGIAKAALCVAVASPLLLLAGLAALTLVSAIFWLSLFTVEISLVLGLSLIAVAFGH